MQGSNITIGIAFAAGILSFLSPCVLPLVPGYVSLISGVSIDRLKEGSATGARRAGRVPAQAQPERAMSNALARLRESVHAAWLERYADRVPGEAGRLDAWRLPVAAARLAEPLGRFTHL